MISKNRAQLAFSFVRHGGDLHRFEHTELGQVGMRRVIRRRRTETRHWNEDRNSPQLGPENRLGTRNPYAVPNTGTFDRWPCNRDPLLSAL